MPNLRALNKSPHNNITSAWANYAIIHLNSAEKNACNLKKKKNKAKQQKPKKQNKPKPTDTSTVLKGCHLPGTSSTSSKRSGEAGEAHVRKLKKTAL